MNDESKAVSRFSVPYGYNVYFTENLFDPANPLLDTLLKEYFSAPVPPHGLFLVDRAAADARPELVRDIRAYVERSLPGRALRVVVTDGGEKVKTVSAALAFCDLFAEERLCRQSYVFIVGGGALLDAAGFAASLFHRGIRQIRIPTTGLSQCDSGVGVKNAVNLLGKKNLLGTFAPPLAVIEDAAFLDTLPAGEISAAAAEALKVSAIKDKDFFEFLARNGHAIMNGDREKRNTMIRKSAELHLAHIAGNGDPFETGSARPLDFGHWSAHRIEMLSHGEAGHGAAVGMGLRVDTKYAVLAGLVPAAVYDKMRAALEAFQLTFRPELFELRDGSGKRAVLAGLDEFREHLGGELHITLIDGDFGHRLEVTSMDTEKLENAIAEVCREARGEREKS